MQSIKIYVGLYLYETFTIPPISGLIIVILVIIIFYVHPCPYCTVKLLFPIKELQHYIPVYSLVGI